MFDVLHAESAQRGQQLLLIEGIPWYYRQFGYEMALELPAARQCDVDQLPDPPTGDGAFRVRPAEQRDLAVVAKLYEQRCAQSRLSCVRDETLWRYELDGRAPECEGYRALSIVESPAGEPVAALAAMDSLRHGLFVVNFCELAGGVPGQKLARHLLGELRRLGEERAARDGGDFKGVILALGRVHPLYELARARLRDGPDPYAFYVRVPDLPGFLRTIAPELERRLAASAFAGHTGAVDVNLYRSGLRLVFDGGRLERVEEWTPDTATRGDVSFPDLTFLQLLTGQRSLAELEDFLPDCLVSNENRGALIDALFPPEPSNMWLVL